MLSYYFILFWTQVNINSPLNIPTKYLELRGFLRKMAQIFKVERGRELKYADNELGIEKGGLP